MERLHQKRIRGLNTAWWQSGNESADAPIAILFHGFPDAPETWKAQLPLLEKDFLVIRPLLRGAGESEGTTDLKRYSCESGLLDHLEILKTVEARRATSRCERQRSNDGATKVLVFGHDIGSIAAWELAQALGSRAIGLVLIAGMGLGTFWNRRFRLRQHRMSWYMYLMQAPLIPEKTFQWFGSQIVRRAYANGGLKLPVDYWEKLQSHVVGMIPHYRAGLFNARKLEKMTSRLECPLLVFWGDQDPFLASVSEDEWKRVARHVEIRVLKAGHWPHQEKADVVNQKVTQFLMKAMPCNDLR